MKNLTYVHAGTEINIPAGVLIQHAEDNGWIPDDDADEHCAHDVNAAHAEGYAEGARAVGPATEILERWHDDNHEGASRFCYEQPLPRPARGGRSVKAISIRQPWAWAVLAGGKNIENRSRNIVGGHRGPVLVHAGQHLADQAAFQRVTDLGDYGIPMLGAPGAVPEAELGGIIGLVDIAGVHPADACAGPCSPWADPTGWHIRLTNPRVLRRMVPCPGRLGLFTPPDDVLEQVRRWMP